MVWVYVEDVDRFVDSLTWANYGEVFSHIWAASAYKGTFLSEDTDALSYFQTEEHFIFLNLKIWIWVTENCLEIEDALKFERLET